ncbi:hypothetical protein CHS0354_009624 [Potamilus streckersoni]|uniref:Uncharacterized protein n=1 Tax=Potamilus streckersoni TaxID=2493646 RepID=A0AAE0WEE3_9BIVA|nr:hypothetical protein CHS0354_009624 [Potamilus streckersoni]
MNELVMMMVSFLMMVKISEGLTWTTETLTTSSCKGQNKSLMWNYSIGENEKVIQLQWYFNNKTLICFHSESMGFYVEPLYQGRVERVGPKGIRLKEISIFDTGEYTLYPKLARKNTKDAQSIVLTVYETPTHRCKPVITIISKNLLSCSTNSCGIPEWRISEKNDPVGNTSYLNVISSWNTEQVICCVIGPNMKCHNGNQSEFCTAILISSKEKYASDRKTIPDKDPNYKDTENLESVILVLIVITGLITTVIFTAAFICWRKHKVLCSKMYQNANADKEHCKVLQAQQRAPIFKDHESSKMDLGKVLQVINNVNIDSYLYKGNIILDSQGASNAEIHALNPGDTSSESSEYEDATSDAGTFTEC